MPDPKLKAAMEEVKAVLKKYDIGGTVVLGSPKHTEFLYALDPSWSCARFVRTPDGQEGIRILSKLVDYPSKEAQKKNQTDTLSLLLGCANMMERMTEMLNGLAVKFKGDITHWERAEE